MYQNGTWKGKMKCRWWETVQQSTASTKNFELDKVKIVWSECEREEKNRCARSTNGWHMHRARMLPQRLPLQLLQ